MKSYGINSFANLDPVHPLSKAAARQAQWNAHLFEPTRALLRACWHNGRKPIAVDMESNAAPAHKHALMPLPSLLSHVNPTVSSNRDRRTWSMACYGAYPPACNKHPNLRHTTSAGACFSIVENRTRDNILFDSEFHQTHAEKNLSSARHRKIEHTFARSQSFRPVRPATCGMPSKLP